MERGRVPGGTGCAGAGRMGSDPLRVSHRLSARTSLALQSPSQRRSRLRNSRPRTEGRSEPGAKSRARARRGLQAGVAGGAVSRKQLAGKPVRRYVNWILKDTHSGCWFLPSSSSSSASEGVQVQRGTGEAVNMRGLFASCCFTGVNGAEDSVGLLGLRKQGLGTKSWVLNEGALEYVKLSFAPPSHSPRPVAPFPATAGGLGGTARG